MLRIKKRKLALVIGVGVVLLGLCMTGAFIIDNRLSVDVGTDHSAEVLFYFIAGCIFLPRALRGYRVGRREVPKVAWYQRLDLTLCLMGLLSGVIFALSVARNWMEFVCMNNLELPQSVILRLEEEIEILDLVRVVVGISWGVLMVVFIYQGVKRRKQRDVGVEFDDKW